MLIMVAGMSGTKAVETRINDPLLYLAPLPHVGRTTCASFLRDCPLTTRWVASIHSGTQTKGPTL